MKSFQLRVLIIVALLMAVIGIGVYFGTGHLRDWALHKASEKSGRDISIANDMGLDWGWPVSGIRLKNLRISNYDKGSAPDMVTADSVFVSINLKSLLKFDLVLPQVILEKPALLLEKDKNGAANWQFTQNADGAAVAEAVTPEDRTDIPEIGQLLIKEGHVTYKDAQSKTNIDLDADTISGSANEKDKLHLKGKGQYQSQDFALDITGGNIFQLQENTTPYPVDLALDVGNTHIRATGSMTDPVKLAGMDIDLTFKGKNAAELFDIIGVALPPTPPYDVKGQLVYEDKVWHFNKFKGVMGKSDLGGSVAWDTTGKRPLLSGQFVSQKLDFKDLGGLVGSKTAVARIETASEEQKREAAEAEADPFVIPDTPLDISRLSSMDAQVTFTGRELISPSLPLDDFYMKVDLNNSLLKLLPVRFGTASGDIEAFMTVNARAKPVKISGDFNFRKLSLKPMFAGLAAKLGKPNYADGFIGGTAKLAGTGDSLRKMLATSDGAIGLGMEGGHLSSLLVEILGLDVAQGLGFFLTGDEPVPIRCIVGDFGVADGLMGVRHFVIDTGDSNVQGKGAINLKNERMALELRTYPKDTTLVSLNSPLGVTGTLKNPSVNLDIKNVAARGILAAAASLIAAPVAALAFIEKGDGHDSNCKKLLDEMNAHTGQSKTKNLIPINK